MESGDRAAARPEPEARELRPEEAAWIRSRLRSAIVWLVVAPILSSGMLFAASVTLAGSLAFAWPRWPGAQLVNSILWLFVGLETLVIGLLARPVVAAARAWRAPVEPRDGEVRMRRGRGWVFRADGVDHALEPQLSQQPRRRAVAAVGWIAPSMCACLVVEPLEDASDAARRDQEALDTAFSTRPSERAQNRLGALTGRQRVRLPAQMLTAFAIVIGCAAFLLTTDEPGWAVAAGLFSVLFAAAAMPMTLDALAGRCEALEGVAGVTRLSGRARRYQLQVGGRTFEVTADGFAAVESGRAYRVWFAPRSGVAVAIERVEPGP